MRVKLTMIIAYHSKMNVVKACKAVHHPRAIHSVARIPTTPNANNPTYSPSGGYDPSDSPSGGDSSEDNVGCRTLCHVDGLWCYDAAECNYSFYGFDAMVQLVFYNSENVVLRLEVEGQAVTAVNEGKRHAHRFLPSSFLHLTHSMMFVLYIYSLRADNSVSY
jgi:hypothetical protein